MTSRRTLLHRLASLPLVGGGLAFIGGSPVTAVPMSGALLDTYDRWLDLERSFLRFNRYGANHADGPFLAPFDCVFRERATGHLFDCWAAPGWGFDHQDPPPETRAALILNAAGVPINRITGASG